MGSRNSDQTDVNRTQLIRHDGAEDEKPSGRTGCLTVIQGRGNDLGKHRVLHQQVIIGRDRHCGFTIEDFGASRQHCRVYRHGADTYVVEDLGSTNGTKVGGSRIDGPWPLRDGEKIFIGDTVLRFRLYDELDLKFSSDVANLIGTDPLTGLQAKRTFDHALEYAIADAARSGLELSLLMMDLDGIKQINDSNGHLFGAYSIQQAGKIIERVIDAQGSACRFGGDEFTAFLPGMGKPAALVLAERIRTTLETADLRKSGVALRPTISIGVATLPGDGVELLELVDAADQALYQAKREGKNRVCAAGADGSSDQVDTEPADTRDSTDEHGQP